MTQTTLQSPDSHNKPPTTTLENKEQGWSFKRIIDYINDMFSDLYTSNVFATIVDVADDLTLTDEHNGKILRFTAEATVTVPSTLTAGFNVGIINYSAAVVDVAAGDGATNRSSTSELATQYTMGSLFVPVATEFMLGGDFT
jgi:hypothetical protein